MLRGICVLYIVGFWHLMNYTSLFRGYSNLLTLRLTVIVLGLFIFLSGYLLNTRGMEPGLQGLKNFYIKRFLRIFPLYLLAIVWFFLFHLSDGTTLLKAGLLISMFYGPPPPTLWFITMIMVFYIIAPLLISSSRQGLRFWLTAGAMFAVMAGISLISPSNDPRILIYFPAFVGGVYVATLRLAYPRALFAVTVAGFALAVALSLSVENFPEHSYFSIPLACFAPMLIFLLSAGCERHLPRLKFFSLISFAGFAMYLFHRPIYLFMKWLYLRLPAVVDADLQIMLYLFLVCLPLVTLISWLIQHGYDRTVAYLLVRVGQSESR